MWRKNGDESLTVDLLTLISFTIHYVVILSTHTREIRSALRG